MKGFQSVSVTHSISAIQFGELRAVVQHCCNGQWHTRDIGCATKIGRLLSLDFMSHMRYLSGDEVREMTNIDTELRIQSMKFLLPCCF